MWAGQYRKYPRKYGAQAWKYPWICRRNVTFSGLDPCPSSLAHCRKPTLFGTRSYNGRRDCPSSLAHCRQPTWGWMLILCRLWQFSDSRRCTWPSILALLWPKNDLSWLLPCAPPPASFTFLSTMRKHFHVHENHEVKIYRCGFH